MTNTPTTQPDEVVYPFKLTSEQLNNSVLINNITMEFFRQGYYTICWLCNPPVAYNSNNGTGSFSGVDKHNVKHQHVQWSH